LTNFHSFSRTNNWKFNSSLYSPNIWS